MAIPSKTRSCFQQLLSKSFPQNNQKVCIDCIKPKSNKNKFECKLFGCTDFYVLDYQSYSFKILLTLQCIK